VGYKINILATLAAAITAAGCSVFTNEDGTSSQVFSFVDQQHSYEYTGSIAPTIQSLRLLSTKEQHELPDRYVLVLMRSNSKARPFCTAVIRNTFYIEQRERMGLMARGSKVLDFIMFDKRTQAEIVGVDRPEFYTKDDCGFIASQYDYLRAEENIQKLRLGKEGGPYLVAVDRFQNKAIIFDAFQFGEKFFERAINDFTYNVNDPNIWTKRKGPFFRFGETIPNVSIIDLPPGYTP
jgi:hypothetical protein